MDEPPWLPSVLSEPWLPPVQNGAATSPRLALFYHPDCVQHTSTWPHIEKRNRAADVYRHLSSCGVLDRCDVHEGRMATDHELLTVHTERHVDEVRRMTNAMRDDPTSREKAEPDGPGGIYYSPVADYTARLACGSVIDAALRVLQGDAGDGSRCAFALVRPPGHHAGYDDTPNHRAEGFCFLNSAAVAAGVALQQGKAKRVAILDWDVHHGNGTQQMFFEEGRVLYISLHRFGDNWYPLTGALEETGSGAGAGANLNVPWSQDGLSDADYLAALELIVAPVLRAFAPELLLISAGFDAAEGDAQGKMRVSPAGFGAMTSMLMQALPGCPLAAALEGGYNSLVTCACTEEVLRVMMGESRPALPARRLAKATESTIRAVLRTQQEHWPVLRGQEAALDRFFAEAMRNGEPERVSKRRRA